jgi:hypothetical protein
LLESRVSSIVNAVRGETNGDVKEVGEDAFEREQEQGDLDGLFVGLEGAAQVDGEVDDEAEGAVAEAEDGQKHPESHTNYGEGLRGHTIKHVYFGLEQKTASIENKDHREEVNNEEQAANEVIRSITCRRGLA